MNRTRNVDTSEASMWLYLP